MSPPKPHTAAAFAKRLRTKSRDDEAVTQLHEAITADLDNKVPYKVLTEITGYSRENLRLIAKAVRDKREPEQGG
jgi:hypothetical protein